MWRDPETENEPLEPSSADVSRSAPAKLDVTMAPKPVEEQPQWPVAPPKWPVDLPKWQVRITLSLTHARPT